MLGCSTALQSRASGRKGDSGSAARLSSPGGKARLGAVCASSQGDGVAESGGI